MACLFLNCNKPTKTNSKNDDKLWKMLKKNAQNEFIINENAQNDAPISLKLVYMASSI